MTFCLPRIQTCNAKEPTLRVLVKEAKQLRIRSDGEKPLMVLSNAFRSKSLSGLKVRVKNGKINLFFDGHSKKWISIPNDSVLRIRSRDPRGIWLGNRRYRGELRLEIGPNGLQAVNNLNIEKYLASVVGSEMPKAWPMEALKAQAVAARTYALQQRRRTMSYDIKSTQSSQVYLGIESETPRTNQAVKKTRSLVMRHHGRLVNAVFHSSSGGFTESSGFAWKKHLPYLVGVPDFDQHSPKYQWEMRFNQMRLRKVFRETAGIKNIQLIRISPTGRVLSARVVGPKSEVIVTGKDLRKRLGLKSTLVRFKMISATQLESNTLNSSLFASSNFKLETPSTTMRKSLGFWRDWSRGGDLSIDPRYPPLEIPPPLFETSSYLTKSLDLPPPIPSISENVVLVARGFGAGHGVGMSQWGANGLANKGASFRQILNHYYKGVVIKPF